MIHHNSHHCHWSHFATCVTRSWLRPRRRYWIPRPCRWRWWCSKWPRLVIGTVGTCGGDLGRTYHQIWLVGRCRKYISPNTWLYHRLLLSLLILFVLPTLCWYRAWSPITGTKYGWRWLEYKIFWLLFKLISVTTWNRQSYQISLAIRIK